MPLSPNGAVAGYPATYAEARAAFRRTAGQAGAALETLTLDGRGEAGEPLSIDIARLGPADASRWLLHVSGVHGLEGFPGSAIQTATLANPPPLEPGAAMVFVHVVNPWGMSHQRRVNENNVDLNRNFLSPGETPPTPELYRKLDALLNPESPPRWDGFLPRLWVRSWSVGRGAVKQVVAGGQYDHPSGLFFGGTTLQQGPKRLCEWLQGSAGQVRRMVVIDVHTGLGRRAQDFLFVDPAAAPHAERHRKFFGPRIVTQAHSGVVYQTTGALIGAVGKLLPQTEVEAFCQELGTWRGPWILKALRSENRWRHFCEGPPPPKMRRELREAFDPSAPAWRAAAMRLGRERIEQGLGLLAAE
ncbi:MAG TPA: DUF2817 domain-containing protein [Planctomycetia bacterium]|nr:DUF2817 domain-containing protein [Planctomycetia bacterium]